MAIVASEPPAVLASPVQIYLVAANALPTYTGLAPQCSHFAQAAAVAAAASQGTAPDAACPAARQRACSQAQLRPDAQTPQSGGFAPGPVNGSDSSAGSPVVWQPPSGSIVGRPAKVQLSLEGGTPPAFTYGPAFPAEMRGGSSFGMQFALDKPALLIYAGERGGGGVLAIWVVLVCVQAWACACKRYENNG